MGSPPGDAGAESDVCLEDLQLGMSCCIRNVSVDSNAVFEEGSWWQLSERQLSYWVMGLSLAATFIGSITKYANPAQRWTQMRGAARILEAELFKFRTRTDVYALKAGNELAETNAEESLRRFIRHLKEHVSKAAAVGNTGFYSQFEFFDQPQNIKRYKHGQYEGCDTAGLRGAGQQTSKLSRLEC